MPVVVNFVYNASNAPLKDFGEKLQLFTFLSSKYRIKGVQIKIRRLQIKITGYQINIRGHQIKIKGLQIKKRGLQIKIKGIRIKHTCVYPNLYSPFCTPNDTFSFQLGTSQLFSSLSFRRRLSAEGAKPESNNRWKSELGHVCMWVGGYVGMYVWYLELSREPRHVAQQTRYQNVGLRNRHCLGTISSGCDF